jgi:sec-independent protein translocase protein TatC
LSFTCKFLLAFGIIFELPVFVLFLAKLGIVNDTQLRSNRKIVILIVFVIAAFLTPPDMVSQVLMAIPLIFLYELSIIIAKFFGKKKVVEEDEDKKEKEA